MRKLLKRCWKCPGREVRLRALSKIALIPVKWLPSPHLINKEHIFSCLIGDMNIHSLHQV